MMNSPFFNFFKPYFDYIDSGKLFRKPYSWLYVVLAVLNLLFPFYVLVKGISVFDQMEAKMIVFFILFWIVLVVAGWLSAQLWWNRKSKVENLTSMGDDFIAIPVISHFFQTLGEWLGTYIAVVGCLGSIFATIFLGESASYFLPSEVPFLDISLGGIILMPIYGFLIIGFSRFIAEQARALASIANNTKK
jgi:hypothetical protein